MSLGATTNVWKLASRGDTVKMFEKNRRRQTNEIENLIRHTLELKVSCVDISRASCSGASHSYIGNRGTPGTAGTCLSSVDQAWGLKRGLYLDIHIIL